MEATTIQMTMDHRTTAIHQVDTPNTHHQVAQLILQMEENKEGRNLLK